MADYIYSIILLIVALSAVELRKSYHLIPKNELRYMAREGDVLAEKIYRAVSYEASLETLLWLVIILSLAGSLLILDSVAPLWLDFIAVVLFIWLAFAWLPRIKPNKLTEKLAAFLTPAVVYLLNYLHPLLKKLTWPTTTQKHTGIYDQKDLIDLLKKQKRQTDSRLDPNDIDLVKKSLKFKNKKISEYAKTWSKIHTAVATDSIGPVLLDELHKSGQLFVPVIADKESKRLVGMVDISRIDLSVSGEVKDIMDKNVYYLNEEDSLLDALKAMSSTGQPVFIVLDKKQRLFGLISLKDVTSQLIDPTLSSRDYTQPFEEEEKEEILKEDEEVATE